MLVEDSRIPVVQLFCPFCREKTDCKVDNAFNHHAVLCLTCHASGPQAESRDLALRNWRQARKSS